MRRIFPSLASSTWLSLLASNGFAWISKPASSASLVAVVVAIVVVIVMVVVIDFTCCQWTLSLSSPSPSPMSAPSLVVRFVAANVQHFMKLLVVIIMVIISSISCSCCCSYCCCFSCCCSCSLLTAATVAPVCHLKFGAGAAAGAALTAFSTKI